LPGQDSVFLDSLPVLPSSLLFRDISFQEKYVGYRFHQNPFAWVEITERQSDTLRLSFQTLSFEIPLRFQSKDSSLIIPDDVEFERPNYSAANSGGSFKPFKGLSSAGSISRGIAVGNNQDAVLQSDLNLQLSGKIGPNTTLSASITDNSIPVQADGYTQQLREFDRVYLELQNPDFGRIRAGDYTMGSNDHYFLRFNKRISGAGIFTAINTASGSIPLQLQGGLARGRFARNRFMAQEGNQGPYKLTGANGEAFIIIISGSERVYVDGILQKRGEQYDYVIDYNAGELSFTALQPMTREKRIVVEFQYTEQNYLRSVFYGSGGFTSENSATTVEYYSEQDSRNQPLLQDLRDSDKETLSEAGDQLDQAVVSTIQRSEFRDDLVLYELRDSLGLDSVLVYSTDSTANLYQASFSRVGNNRGNYRLSQNDGNGRVFEFVAPQNGVPQGSYAPVRQLIAPNRLQILSLKSDIRIGKNQQVNLQLAGSDNNQNLFSDEDSEDDRGTAAKIRYQLRDTLEAGQVLAAVNYELNQQNFTTIERIRQVEFSRDWNLSPTQSADLHLGGLQLGFNNTKLRSLFESNFLKTGDFAGFKNDLKVSLQDSAQRFNLWASHLSASDSLTQSRFSRGSLLYRYQITQLLWGGITAGGEWNERQQADSLRSSSYRFGEATAFAGVGDTLLSFAELSYTRRFDDTAQGGELKPFSVASAYKIRGVFKSKFNTRIQAALNHRVLDRLNVETPSQTTTTLRLNVMQRLFKNAVVSNSFYEAGSGTEPRRTFSYVEVPAGQGQYTHTDYNNNGIKELGEFELAPTPDLATYLRVFTVTDDYLRTSLQKFSQTFNLSAPTAWASSGAIGNLSQKFTALANFQLDRKTLLEGSANTINPFKEIENDSLIVALNNNIRSTLFFNRGQNQYGGEYTYRQTSNRNLLSFGVEERSVNEHRLSARYQVWPALLARVESAWIEKGNLSQNFENRSFEITETQNRYSLSYQPGTQMVLTGFYGWADQESGEETATTLFSQRTGLELQYNGSKKLTGRATLSFINNNFSGEANSPVGFEMLKELRPGNNGTWELVLQRAIRENVLLSLSYSGRVSANNRPIHTGNLEVRAFF